MPLVAVCGADHHKKLDGDLSIAPMELSPHITLPSLTIVLFVVTTLPCQVGL